MTRPPVHVHRLPHRIKPDPSRMITRFFGANEEANRGRIERVLTLPAAEVQEILADLKGRYGARHPEINEIWMESFERVAALVPPGAAMDDKRRMLIGAYFTMEYAVEGAALFNPSIVPAINQTGVPPGCTRFLMSLRATTTATSAITCTKPDEPWGRHAGNVSPA